MYRLHVCVSLHFEMGGLKFDPSAIHHLSCKYLEVFTVVLMYGNLKCLKNGTTACNNGDTQQSQCTDISELE